MGKYDCPVRFLGDKDGSKVTTVVATTGSLPDRTQEISYTDTKVIGNGSFGVVYQARMCDSSELVAIKKVLQDKRFKVFLLLLFRLTTIYTCMPVSVWRFRFRNAEIRFNTGNIKLFFQNRELQIMRKLDHCNIVRLRWFFYSSGEKVSYSLSYWYLKKDVMRFWDRCLNIAMSFCISWIEPAKGRLFHVVCWTAYVGVRTLIALIQ